MMPEVKYQKAVERLDDLIAQLENDEIDVDELSVRVKEAIELIRTCKAKIDKAELDVKKAVASLAQEGES